MKIILGLAIGFAIGLGCRWFDIPSASPPQLVGALLVVAMTVGYTLADRLLSHRPNTSGALCGGPTGKTPQSEMQK